MSRQTRELPGDYAVERVRQRAEQFESGLGVYLTTAALSNHSHGNPTLALTNLTGTTASASNGFTLSLSAAAPGAGGAGNVLAAGANTAQTSGTVLFSNANGITFGLDGAAGSIITASHNALTTAMASNRGSDFVQASAAFAGTNASGTIASNGLSISVGNYLTTAMASNRGSDFVAASATIAGTNITGTVASNGLSLSVGNYLTTAMASNRGSDFVAATAAFAGTSASGTIGSGGISISVGPYLTTAAAVGHTHGNPTLALTNLSGTTASASNGLTLSLSAGNYLTTAAQSDHTHGNPTLALTNLTGTTASASNGLTISLSAAAPGAGGGIGLNTAGTNITWTANSSGLSINAAGYAGTGTTFAGANLSASATLNSNGLNLSMSAAAPGGGAGATVSAYAPPWAHSGRATNSSAGQNSLYFMPFDVYENVYASRINFYLSQSGALSAGNSTGTCYYVASYALYTRNSDSLSRLTSYGATVVSHSMSSNTAYGATHYAGLSNATSHTTVQTGLSTSNATTYLATRLNGPRVLALPVNSTLTPGRYYLAFANSTISGNAMTNNWSVQMTSVGLQPDVRPYGVASAATNASVFRAPIMQGFGTYSATSGAFPNTVAFTTDHIRHGVAITQIHFDILGYSTNTNLL